MKQEYKRAEFTLTQFDEEDVITTSVVDRNNAYKSLEALNQKGSGAAAPPGSWV